MKKLIFSIIAIGVLAVIGSFVYAEDNPLNGRIIALDAGHGGGETGATNTIDGIIVTEADVNLSVVDALKTKLEEQGVYVVTAERLSSRKDRVNDVISKCAALDLDSDGTADNKKCGVLVSVHHNGSIDPDHDGTLVIYNEKKDKPLAEKMLAALLPLSGNSEGLEHGGYGMTVYGNLISVITEAYYITNDIKAWRYLYDLNAEGVSNLVLEEANAQVKGLTDYFTSKTSGGNGRGPKK